MADGLFEDVGAVYVSDGRQLMRVGRHRQPLSAVLRPTRSTSAPGLFEAALSPSLPHHTLAQRCVAALLQPANQRFLMNLKGNAPAQIGEQILSAALRTPDLICFAMIKPFVHCFSETIFHLDLSGFALGEQHTALFPKMLNLSQLLLNDCGLTDAFIAKLNFFPHLEHLSLNYNHLSGRALDYLSFPVRSNLPASLQQLKTLSVKGNTSIRDGLRHLLKIPTLLLVDVSETDVDNSTFLSTILTEGRTICRDRLEITPARQHACDPWLENMYMTWVKSSCLSSSIKKGKLHVDSENTPCILVLAPKLPQKTDGTLSKLSASILQRKQTEKERPTKFLKVSPPIEKPALSKVLHGGLKGGTVKHVIRWPTKQ